MSPQIVLYVVQTKSAKNSRAVISRLTGFGSFLALLVSSTLHGFLIIHAACSSIGPYLVVSLPPRYGPGGGLRVDRERTRARCETNNNGSTNTQLRLDGAAWTVLPHYDVPRTKSHFRIAVAAARKNDRPRGTRTDTFVNRLGRRDLFKRAVVCTLIKRQTVKWLMFYRYSKRETFIFG